MGLKKYGERGIREGEDILQSQTDWEKFDSAISGYLWQGATEGGMGWQMYTSTQWEGAWEREEFWGKWKKKSRGFGLRKDVRRQMVGGYYLWINVRE